MLRVRQESLILSVDDDEYDAELPPLIKLEAALDVGTMLFEKLAVFCNEVPVRIEGGVIKPGVVVSLFELVKGWGDKLVASWIPDDGDELALVVNCEVVPVLLNETVEIGNGFAFEVVEPFVNCWVVVVYEYKADAVVNVFVARELGLLELEKVVDESVFKLFVSWFVLVVFS